jgi:hypothetical protein
MPAPFTLILAILTIESSYLEEIERLANSAPDTVQFWISQESQWRIKTFAIDHDIHMHRLQGHSAQLTTDFARKNIEKSYGGVTAAVLVLEFTDPNDEADVKRVLAAHKLNGRLVVTSEGCAFYSPDKAVYRTKSTPK